jgi:hypothetical protein
MFILEKMAEAVGGIDKGPELPKAPEIQRRQTIRKFVEAANNSGLKLSETKEADGREGFWQILGEGSYPVGHDGKNLWMALDADPKNLKTPDDWNTNSLISKDNLWITQTESGRRLTLPEDNPLAQLIKNLPKENPALLVGEYNKWTVDGQYASGKFQIGEKGEVFVDLPDVEGEAYECKVAVLNFPCSWKDGNWKKGSTQKLTV